MFCTHDNKTKNLRFLVTSHKDYYCPKVTIMKINNALITKKNRLSRRILKLNNKLLKKGTYLPLQGIWSIKDEIKQLEHDVLLLEQQIRFNLITAQYSPNLYE